MAFHAILERRINDVCRPHVETFLAGPLAKLKGEQKAKIVSVTATYPLGDGVTAEVFGTAIKEAGRTIEDGRTMEPNRIHRTSESGARFHRHPAREGSR